VWVGGGVLPAGTTTVEVRTGCLDQSKLLVGWLRSAVPRLGEVRDSGGGQNAKVRWCGCGRRPVAGFVRSLPDSGEGLRLIEVSHRGELTYSYDDLEPHTVIDSEIPVSGFAGGVRRPMTLDRDVFDQNSEMGFMTYGHPVFESLLNRVLGNGRQ